VSEKSTVNAFVQSKINSVTSGSQYGQKFVPFSSQHQSGSDVTPDVGTIEEKKSMMNSVSEMEIRNLEIDIRKSPIDTFKIT